FSARRTAPVDDLELDVRGVGRVLLPVSAEQANQLCRVGRPATYGLGDKTLLDARVRNTWEIPISRVKLNQRRWAKALVPARDCLRADLGLPPGCRLKAELHSMLVYGAGQFFVPHQDSEKADAMVGSLVVTLPSSFKGGALVVRHAGMSATYRSPKKSLSLVAFSADCPPRGKTGHLRVPCDAALQPPPTGRRRNGGSAAGAGRSRGRLAPGPLRDRGCSRSA